MLSKLRGQLEEMKSKVHFLGLVKKYLQASSLPTRPPCFQNECQPSDAQMGSFSRSMDQVTLGHSRKVQRTEKPCYSWVSSNVTHGHACTQWSPLSTSFPT